MNILITSAGRRAYLINYFKDALLSSGGKVYASNSEYSIALQEADDYLITPMIYSDKYIDSILKYCKTNDIKAIISVFDIDLPVLSKSKDYIESEGMKLLVSREESINICNDKWLTYKFLQDIDVKTPLTFKTVQDTLNALEGGLISYPIVIKPRWGMASLGIYYANNKDELLIFASKCQEQIDESYLKYESDTTPGESILFQTMLKGVEYGLDVINDLDGNYVCTLPKSKLAMRAGETDIGQTVNAKKFEKISKKISKELKHEVIVSVDCFEANKDIYVTEMNCRISGHYPLSHLAGVDLPRQIVEWLDGRATDMSNFKFKEGLYITKKLEPVILDRERYNK